MTAQVVGRHIFYPGSVWGETIAPDKTALRPGQSAAFANYISYVHGIKGLFVDVEGLANPGALSASDFCFAQGNDDEPVYWPATDDPESVSVEVGGGVDGSDRIKLLWSSSACDNSRWLEVTVRATANTGLADDDVHYWGLAIGEIGDSATDAMVTDVDWATIRDHLRESADIENPWDLDRDGMIKPADWLNAQLNMTDESTCLNLITPSLWRFRAWAAGGKVCVMGQEAGLVERTGQLAGNVCVIGHEAGLVQHTGRMAGQVSVIGQSAGKTL